MRLARGVRRRPVTSVLVVAGVLAAGWFGTTYTHAVREWRRAEAALREGRAADARTHLEVCLAAWPRSVAVHQRAARAARMTGDFTAAEYHLNTCLRLEDGASEATQLEFLLMRAQSGEVEEVAGLLFGFVDRGHPDARLILQTVASTYMHNLRYGPAYAALKRWSEAFPDDPRAFHYRGWVLERMNQPTAAKEDYQRALELDQGLVGVRLRVAEMYLEDNDPVQATPHLDLLLATAPDRPDVLARVGELRYLQGRHPESRQFLERIVDHLPNDPRVLLILGRLDTEDGNGARAEDRLRTALTVDPSNTEVRYALVAALRLQRKDAAADAELAEFERHKAHLLRANHLLQEEARHPSRDPAAPSEIGTLLLQVGQDRQGLYWMDEALTRDPHHRPTHQALAEYFERKGDADRAAFHRKALR